MPTKGADEYEVAELNNGVIGSGFTEVHVGVSNDSVEIGKCECQD